jgi:hypothetical protein
MVTKSPVCTYINKYRNQGKETLKRLCIKSNTSPHKTNMTSSVKRISQILYPLLFTDYA